MYWEIHRPSCKPEGNRNTGLLGCDVRTYSTCWPDPPEVRSVVWINVEASDLFQQNSWCEGPGSSPLRVQQSLLRMVLVNRLIIHGSVLGLASNKPITALKARYTAPRWIIILWWRAVSHRDRFIVEFYLLCTTLHQGPRVTQDALLTMWLTKWQLIISLTLVPSLIFTVAIKQEQPWVPQTHAVPQWVR